MKENFWNEETILKSLILMIREYTEETNTWSIEELMTIFEFYMEQSDSYKKDKANYLLASCKDYIQKIDSKEYYYIMSFLLHATKDRELYKKLINHCIEDCKLEKENKFYLYYQFVSFNFVVSEIVDNEIEELMDDFYSHIYKLYYNEVAVSCEIIPKEERNQNLVVVFTSQVLNLNHGPTKTLLDRCYILEEVLKKKVLVINTAECAPTYGKIDFFRAGIGNYFEEYLESDNLPYKGKKYAFLQCPKEMPQVAIIQQILEVIKEEKPYFILTIGGSSIVSDICSNVIPSLTISLAPSDRAMTRGQFQTIGRKISKNDLKWLRKHEYSKEHIIESLFTSAFKEQTHKYTREQLGLPEKGFIAVLVGGRLDWEVDEVCMNMLLNLMKNGIYIAFVGRFEKYDEKAINNQLFREYSINLGFQEDVLAVYECCNLYINPRRIGGGTSVAEALYKGLPVVTMDFGDGAVGTGEDFFVKDYDEMYYKVLQYANNGEFFALMSDKAKKRAEKLMDSETEFVRVIRIMEALADF